MTEKEKALTGLVWFANMSWKPYNAISSMTPSPLKCKEMLVSYMKNNVDFKKMNAQDLLDIGFVWSSDEKHFMLCPLYLAEVFFPGKDHDTRGGYIAYGFSVNNGEVDWEVGGVV